MITEALRAQRPWGAAFTNYDTLAAFNMQAVRETGPWDINLPQYSLGQRLLPEVEAGRL